VLLVRVDDPDSGKIWLISKETVASIPQLYAQMESEGLTLADRIVPVALTSRRVFGISLAQWLGWLLSIPISWFVRPSIRSLPQLMRWASRSQYRKY
jgi:MscS family membrane protein